MIVINEQTTPSSCVILTGGHLCVKFPSLPVCLAPVVSRKYARPLCSSASTLGLELSESYTQSSHRLGHERASCVSPARQETCTSVVWSECVDRHRSFLASRTSSSFGIASRPSTLSASGLHHFQRRSSGVVFFPSRPAMMSALRSCRCLFRAGLPPVASLPLWEALVVFETFRSRSCCVFKMPMTQ